MATLLCDYGSTNGSWTTASTWPNLNCTSTGSWSLSDIKATMLRAQSSASYTWGDLEAAWYDGAAKRMEKIEKGRNYDLPDGAKLIVDDLGNYHIEDAAAKVTYKANRIREFSPHLNASDLVAQFLGYAGKLGVLRDDVLKLPIDLFISWLIIEAAERDDDPLPSDMVRIEHAPQIKELVKPKCLSCGRFIRRLHQRNRFPFCSAEHGAHYVSRQQRLGVTTANQLLLK